MPEILTESFCERCGTRYTFQTAAPRRSRLSRLKVIARGLRNYVLSDETTLEEAFADARGDEEREISAQQLEAFHQTFNFCLSCRQYTCANCWNEAEGRCLTCAPDLSREPLAAPFPTLSTSVAPIGAAVEVGDDGAASGWPAGDLAAEAPPMPVQHGETVSPAPAVSVADALPSPEAPSTAPTSSPTERAAAAAEQTAALLGRFRPPARETPAGATAAEAPSGAHAEASPVEIAPASHPAEPPGTEPTVVESAAAAALAEPGTPSEAVSGGLEPAAEAIPGAAGVLPAAGLPGHPAAPSIPATPPTDRIAQPVWPSAPAPSAPAPSAGPPPGPAWPPPHLAARPAAGHALAAEAVWTESSRDVLAPRTGGVQACIACGLPLSATARFCRRCGSRQERA